jgi:hypothetical protein
VVTAHEKPLGVLQVPQISEVYPVRRHGQVPGQLELAASLFLELHCAVERLVGARLVTGRVPRHREDDPAIM